MDPDRSTTYSELRYNKFSNSLNGLLNNDIHKKTPASQAFSTSSSTNNRLALRLEQFISELYEEININNQLQRHQKMSLTQSLMAMENLIQSLRYQYHDELPLQLFQIINRIAQHFENITKGISSRSHSNKSIHKRVYDGEDHTSHFNTSFHSNRSSLLSPSETVNLVRTSSPVSHKQQEWDGSESEFDESF